MASREEMLARVRKALGRSQGSRPPVPEDRNQVLGSLADVMPAIPPDQLLPKFEEELAKVGGTAHRASSREGLEGILRKILEGLQASSVVLSQNPILAELNLAERLRSWGQSVLIWPAVDEPDEGQDAPTGEKFRAASFEAQVGITGVDFVLAETGSLIVTSQIEGSQLSSLAPPVHVALYRRSQLFGSLDEVLERLPVAKQPGQLVPGRSVVFITGTSRTADIEQVLIRGVHGPREVHAILVEDSCF